MSAKPLIELDRVERVCEACGDASRHTVCDWSHEAITRGHRWLFHNTIVICERCGFTFLSPCFRPADLTKYYGDSFSRFGGQALDFSPEKRLAFIDEVLRQQGKTKVEGVIELGGNENTTFQEGLRQRFGRVSSYEPNSECESDFQGVQAVPDSSFDLLVHYFILEHIAEVRPFLRECHRMMRRGGVMVVEVPDLLLYPRYIDALILHEHCNHFTLESLRHLAALEGFRFIAGSNESCSRPFGFVAAFERLEDGGKDDFQAHDFERNLAVLDTGVKRVRDYRDRVAQTLEELEANPQEKVVLWGANDNLMKMLPADRSLPNAVLVDSDPRKKHFHGSLTAVPPLEAVEALRAAGRLILFTRLHAPAILQWIEENTGRRFEDAVILDY